MKRFLVIVLAVFGILVAVFAGNALLLESRQGSFPPVATIDVDESAVVRRLAEVLKLETISHQNPADFDGATFLALHARLEQLYPLVHQTLSRERVNGYSLLYRWQGTDATREPIMLMSHLDVVPVEPGTEGEWVHPPFGGVIADGYVWGRGAIDTKSSVTASLEAIEALIASGFTAPARTIYLAFGHDEEVGGFEGALRIAKLLEKRGVRLAYTIDEGMVIVEGIMPGFEKPIALVGLAEKGYVSLRLTARVRGGHSATPPRETTLGALARAVAALEASPMPIAPDGPIEELFDFLVPEMGLGMRLALANRWLTGPVITTVMERSAATNAMLRTTTAPTIIRGGVKENVLPTEAYAVVNFRIMPGDSLESVLAHARSVVEDPAVSVEPLDDAGNEPSRVSSPEADGFRVIERSVREVFPDVVVAPGLVLGGTDSRHYEVISRDVYRFVPWRVSKADMARIHGTNERVAVANYANVVRYYGQIIRNAADPSAGAGAL